MRSDYDGRARSVMNGGRRRTFTHATSRSRAEPFYKNSATMFRMQSSESPCAAFGIRT
jgi:hypothetical protein